MKDLAGLALNELLDAYADAVIAGDTGDIIGGDVVAPDALSTMQKILDELSRRTTCPDPNVESVRRLLLTRSEVGTKKYGTTTHAAGLSLEAWLTHLLEELADAAVYTTAALERHRALEAELREKNATIEELSEGMRWLVRAEYCQAQRDLASKDGLDELAKWWRLQRIEALVHAKHTLPVLEMMDAYTAAKQEGPAETPSQAAGAVENAND